MDEAALGFSEVAAALSVALEGRGFRLVSSTDQRRLFSNDRLEIELSHDRRIGDILVIFKILHSSGRFSIADAASSLGISERTDYQVLDQAAGRFVGERLSAVLTSLPDSLLIASEKDVQEVRKTQNAYTTGLFVSEWRSRANDAWMNRDFEGVVRWLGRLEERQLTAAEKRKLDYAKNALDY